MIQGGFAADDTSVYGDRRFRNNGVGGAGGGYNYDNWEMNNNRQGVGGMYNDEYDASSNQGFYPPPPPPPLPQMMGGGNSGGNQGPMRPLINSYYQPPSAQTQQVRIARIQMTFICDRYRSR
jgi:hypothetical protein